MCSQKKDGLWITRITPALLGFRRGFAMRIVSCASSTSQTGPNWTLHLYMIILWEMMLDQYPVLVIADIAQPSFSSPFSGTPEVRRTTNISE